MIRIPSALAAKKYGDTLGAYLRAGIFTMRRIRRTGAPRGGTHVPAVTDPRRRGGGRFLTVVLVVALARRARARGRNPPPFPGLEPWQTRMVTVGRWLCDLIRLARDAPSTLDSLAARLRQAYQSSHSDRQRR